MADSRESFYQQAAAIPRLTRDDERRLSIAARAGDTTARNRIVVANIRLAHRSAAYYAKHNRSVDIEDLIQVGMIGLHEAATRFDPDTGYRFSTYADWWIKQKQRRWIEQTHSRVMRVPTKHAFDYFGKRMTDEQRAHYEAVHFNTVSMDANLPGSTKPLADAIADPAPDPAHIVELSDTVRTILAALAAADVAPRDREILMRWTGMHDGGSGETMSIIAQRFDISAQRVGQIIERTVEQIRRTVT